LTPRPSDPQTALVRTLRERFGLGPGDRVVVGASGGVDSTVLLWGLHGAGLAVVAAHVNYGLRGADADADEAFVRALAAELGAPCHVRCVEEKLGGNVQAAARDLRYRFFEEVAAAEGAGVAAVGSTRDDQAETVLLHLFRGSGPRGLAGMPAERPLARGSSVRLVRPLLAWGRAEVEAWALEKGWAWREDASNARPTYRRNALRHEVLPVVRRHFGEDVAERVAASAARVGAWAGAPGLLLDAFDALGGGLPVAALRALPAEVRHGLYLAALARHAPGAPRSAAIAARIDRLLDAQAGRRVEVGAAAVWRERARLVVEEGGVGEAETPVPAEGAVATPFGTLAVEPLAAVPAPAPGGTGEEVVDADVLTPPLVLRPWRAGDAFRPLGMEGTKRVSDLLTERKVPPGARARQLVLTAAGRIVWVVGHRLAHEARLTPATARAVRLTWEAGAGPRGAASGA
jgi:tRNA(Ile)-lysidine synthase